MPRPCTPSEPPLPSLPHDLALHVLSLLPRSSRPPLRAVARKWRAAMDSAELASLRKEVGTSEEWVYIVGKSMGKQKLLALSITESKWFYAGDLPYLTRAPLEHGALEDTPLHGFELLAANHELILIGGLQTMSCKAYSASMQHMAASFSYFLEVGGGGSSDTCREENGWKGEGDKVEGYAYREVQRRREFEESEQTTVAGGVWRYNLHTSRWREAAPMKAGSRTYFASGLIGQKIYIVGGISADGDSLNSAEVYDLERDTWLSIAPLPATENFNLCTKRLAGAVLNDKLYVLGVCPCRGGLLVLLGVFDPKTFSWTVPHKSPSSRPLSDRNPQGWSSGGGVLGIQTVASGGKIYFTRGLLDDCQGWGDRELRSYDVATNEWSTVSYIPAPGEGIGREWQHYVQRQAFGLAGTREAVLVVGGDAWARLFGRLEVKNVEMFKTESEKWGSVGGYEAEMHLGAVWKCATVLL